MKFFVKSILFSILIFMFACAKEPVQPGNYTYELKAFQQWMSKYAPGVDQVADEPGLYMTVFPGAGVANVPTEGADNVPVEGDWIKVNFNLSNLGENGMPNYIETRYWGVANRMGWEQNTTYYVPQYVMFKKDNFVKGEYIALGKMAVGDSASLYMSSKYAFGSQGYSANTEGFSNGSISSNNPCLMNMTLTQIIKDPEAYELDSVNKYALRHLKLTEKDTIEAGLYVKITPLEGAPATDRPVIGADTIVKVNYSAWFLTGFLVDTNIFDIANNHRRTVSNDGKPLVMTTAKSGMIDGFNKAILKMHKGDKAKIVMTSKYAYGESGINTKQPFIQSYTPLYYEIEILVDPPVVEKPKE